MDVQSRKKIVQTVRERHNDLCVYCGIETNENDRMAVCIGPKGEISYTLGPTYPTMDHIIPAKYGGEFTLENLVLACYECNYNRGS